MSAELWGLLSFPKNVVLAGPGGPIASQLGYHSLFRHVRLNGKELSAKGVTLLAVQDNKLGHAVTPQLLLPIGNPPHPVHSPSLLLKDIISIVTTTEMDQILNPAQQAAFSSFKQLCTERGLLALTEQPGFGNGDVFDGLVDDVTLLRFLQARKFNPADALEQYREARTFHAEKGILQLYDSIGMEDYEATRRLYPHWTGRRTKAGLPIMILDTSHLDPAAITHWRDTCNPTADSPDMAQRVCVFHDTATRFILPLCSAMRDRPDGSSSRPIMNCLYLVDVSTVTLKQAWSLTDFAREVSWILERCYPETIQCIMLCNAPTSFSLFWTIIKKLLDPATVDKLLVLRSAEVYPVLSQHIEHDDIPAWFGGAFDFERENESLLPVLDGGLCEVLGRSPTSTENSGSSDNDGSKCSKSGSEAAAEVRRLPPGPLKWVRDDDAGVQKKAIATGRIGDVQRSETIATLDVK